MARNASRSLPLLAAASAALLLLLACSAAASRAAATLSTGSSAGTRRALLTAPCCEKCEDYYSGDDENLFYCFRDCQDCVEGTQCIELSRDVAGRIADVGCEYANSQCQPQQAVAASLQVPREECYQAAKNVCLTYAEDYATSGSGSCYGYNNGIGNCDASQYQQYFNDKVDSLCDSVANGIAISLP